MDKSNNCIIIINNALKNEISNVSFCINQGLLKLSEILVNFKSTLAKFTDEIKKESEDKTEFRNEENHIKIQLMIQPTYKQLREAINQISEDKTAKENYIVYIGSHGSGYCSDWYLKDGIMSPNAMLTILVPHELSNDIEAEDSHRPVNIITPGNSAYWNKILSKLKHKDSNQDLVRVFSFTSDTEDVNQSSHTEINTFANVLCDRLQSKLKACESSKDVLNHETFQLVDKNGSLHIFDEGSGQSSLLSLNGFNLLIDAGYSYKPESWNALQTLDRIDTCLITNWTEINIFGIRNLLEQKLNQIGPCLNYCILPIGPNINKPFAELKPKSFLEINLELEAINTCKQLQALEIPMAQISRDDKAMKSPHQLYFKVGHGCLEAFPLWPLGADSSGDTKKYIDEWHKNGKGQSVHFDEMIKENSTACLLLWNGSKTNDLISIQDNLMRILISSTCHENILIKSLEELSKSYSYCNTRSGKPMEKKVETKKQKPVSAPNKVTANNEPKESHNKTPEELIKPKKIADSKKPALVADNNKINGVKAEPITKIKEAKLLSADKAAPLKETVKLEKKPTSKEPMRVEKKPAVAQNSTKVKELVKTEKKETTSEKPAKIKEIVKIEKKPIVAEKAAPLKKVEKDDSKPSKMHSTMSPSAPLKQKNENILKTKPNKSDNVEIAKSSRLSSAKSTEISDQKKMAKKPALDVNSKKPLVDTTTKVTNVTKKPTVTKSEGDKVPIKSAPAAKTTKKPVQSATIDNKSKSQNKVLAEATVNKCELESDLEKVDAACHHPSISLNTDDTLNNIDTSELLGKMEEIGAITDRGTDRQLIVTPDVHDLYSTPLSDMMTESPEHPKTEEDVEPLKTDGVSIDQDLLNVNEDLSEDEKVDYIKEDYPDGAEKSIEHNGDKADTMDDLKQYGIYDDESGADTGDIKGTDNLIEEHDSILNSNKNESHEKLHISESNEEIFDKIGKHDDSLVPSLKDATETDSEKHHENSAETDDDLLNSDARKDDAGEFPDEIIQSEKTHDFESLEQIVDTEDLHNVTDFEKENINNLQTENKDDVYNDEDLIESSNRNEEQLHDDGYKAYEDVVSDAKSHSIFNEGFANHDDMMENEDEDEKEDHFKCLEDIKVNQFTKEGYDVMLGEKDEYKVEDEDNDGDNHESYLNEDEECNMIGEEAEDALKSHQYPIENGDDDVETEEQHIELNSDDHTMEKEIHSKNEVDDAISQEDEEDGIVSNEDLMTHESNDYDHRYEYMTEKEIHSKNEVDDTISHEVNVDDEGDGIVRHEYAKAQESHDYAHSHDHTMEKEIHSKNEVDDAISHDVNVDDEEDGIVSHEDLMAHESNEYDHSHAYMMERGEEYDGANLVANGEENVEDVRYLEDVHDNGNEIDKDNLEDGDDLSSSEKEDTRYRDDVHSHGDSPEKGDDEDSNCGVEDDDRCSLEKEEWHGIDMESHDNQMEKDEDDLRNHDDLVDIKAGENIHCHESNIGEKYDDNIRQQEDMIENKDVNTFQNYEDKETEDDNQSLDDNDVNEDNDSVVRRHDDSDSEELSESQETEVVKYKEQEDPELSAKNDIFDRFDDSHNSMSVFDKERKLEIGVEQSPTEPNHSVESSQDLDRHKTDKLSSVHFDDNMDDFNNVTSETKDNYKGMNYDDMLPSASVDEWSEIPKYDDCGPHYGGGRPDNIDEHKPDIIPVDNDLADFTSPDNNDVHRFDIQEKFGRHDNHPLYYSPDLNSASPADSDLSVDMVKDHSVIEDPIDTVEPGTIKSMTPLDEMSEEANSLGRSGADAIYHSDEDDMHNVADLESDVNLSIITPDIIKGLKRTNLCEPGEVAVERVTEDEELFQYQTLSMPNDDSITSEAVSGEMKRSMEISDLVDVADYPTMAPFEDESKMMDNHSNSTERGSSVESASSVLAQKSTDNEMDLMKNIVSSKSITESVSNGGSHDNSHVDDIDLLSQWNAPLGLPIPTMPATNKPTSKSSDPKSSDRNRPTSSTTKPKTTPPKLNGSLSNNAIKLAPKSSESPKSAPSPRSNVTQKSLTKTDDIKKTASTLQNHKPDTTDHSKSSAFYMDVAFIPVDHDGNVNRTRVTETFFTRIRAHHYVLPGMEHDPLVLDSLLSARKKWSDTSIDTELILVPVTMTHTLATWAQLHAQELTQLNISIRGNDARSSTVVHRIDF